MTETIQITALKGFGVRARDDYAKKQWDKLWSEIGERIQSLPAREQRIILEDILTAINSRLYVFEHIQKP